MRKVALLILFILVFETTAWAGLSKKILVSGAGEIPDIKGPGDLYFLEDYETYRVVYEPLFSRDSLDIVQPRHVIKWSVSHDEKILTFELNPKSRFSDGSFLTSDDVVASFLRIIRSDKDKKMILTRCLGSKEEKGLQILGERGFKIFLGTCNVTRLIEELSSPDYGILKKGVFPKHPKSAEDLPPALGIYKVFHRSAEEIKLIPNPFHWAWQGIKNENRPELIVKKQSFHDEKSKSLPWHNFDFLKTHSFEVEKKAFESGLNHTIRSPKIMSWFLAPAKNSNPSQFTESINFINTHKDFLLRLNLPHLKPDGLETRAYQFFPEDFNCDSKWRLPKKQVHINKTIHLYFLRHPTGQDKEYLDDLSEFYSNSELVRVHQVQSLKQVPDNQIVLSFYRQFLGPDFLTTFQLSFLTLNQIPDPTGTMKNLLSKLDKTPKDEQASILKSMCSKLIDQPFVPIAHRQISFVAKEQKYLKLFSRASGYYSYINIPNIYGE